MDQLIYASLFRTHYWYEAGMLNKRSLIEDALYLTVEQSGNAASRNKNKTQIHISTSSNDCKLAVDFDDLTWYDANVSEQRPSWPNSKKDIGGMQWRRVLAYYCCTVYRVLTEQ